MARAHAVIVLHVSLFYIPTAQGRSRRYGRSGHGRTTFLPCL